MTGLKLKFEGIVSIDWGSTVSGIELLMQRAACNMLTEIGSDKVTPTRGTELDKRLMGTGAYNLMAIQHELNFAAAATKQFMKVTGSTLPDTELLTDFQMRLAGLENGRPAVNLNVTNAAGETLGKLTTI
jgi:hypothetical protein